MGLFSQIKRSQTKSKLMARLIDALQYSNDKREIDLHIANFYNFISEDYILAPILRKYDADLETITYLVEELNTSCGGRYGGWYKNQYIPVSTFGFSSSLECALKEYRAGSSIELILFEVQKRM